MNISELYLILRFLVDIDFYMLIPHSLSYSYSGRTAFVIARNPRDLAEQLYLCSQDQFTGQLDLKLQDTEAKAWSLYYQAGHLVWGTGGIHPIRRWYRQLAQNNSISAIASTDIEKNNFHGWNYDLLAALLAQEKIHNEDIEAIAKGLIVEIFFDLYQHWARYRSSKLQMQFNYVSANTAQPRFIKLSLDAARSQALKEWEAWQQAELENYSPNQAPLIWNVKELQQQVLPSTYQNLTIMMDGRQTLRDLAIKSNNSLLSVTKSFVPYIQQGLVKLLEVEDLQPPAKVRVKTPQQLPPISSSPSSISSQASAPSIVYIDDHKEDGHLMSQILSEMGYQCLYVQDPMQTLPLLLDHKPNLIFLDLVMPIINGYEACAQIRRISRFKETPIIILTSSDGVIDRVRAKMAGSTGFLAKPIKPRKIQAILEKYLGHAYNQR